MRVAINEIVFLSFLSVALCHNSPAAIEIVSLRDEGKPLNSREIDSFFLSVSN